MVATKMGGGDTTELVGGSTSQSGTSTGLDKPNKIKELESIFEPLKKDLKESIKEISLSAAARSSLEIELNAFTEKTRERAIKLVENLIRQFPAEADEIAYVFSNLRQFGAPDGKPIVSPLGLIENAWPQLRDFFRTKQEIIKNANNREVEHNRVANQITQEREQAIAHNAKVRSAFEIEFPKPEEKLLAFQHYAPNGLVDPSTSFGQMLAMNAWYEQLNTNPNAAVKINCVGELA